MPGPLFVRATGLPPRPTRKRTSQAAVRLSRLSGAPSAYDAKPSPFGSKATNRSRGEHRARSAK